MSLMFKGFIAVGLGAAIGAWLRWGLSAWMNPVIGKFPLGTLAANMIGGFLVGLGVAFFVRHPEISPVWRLFAITGFLGGLTTFSTYSAEVVGLLDRGDVAMGLAVAAAHLIGSFALTALGFWVYRAVAGQT
jgi:CrcB protein